MDHNFCCFYGTKFICDLEEEFNNKMHYYNLVVDVNQYIYTFGKTILLIHMKKTLVYGTDIINPWSFLIKNILV